jgi:hypothetical protein
MRAKLVGLRRLQFLIYRYTVVEHKALALKLAVWKLLQIL